MIARISCSFFLFWVLFLAGSARASTYLDLDDPVNELFARLEAEGIIRSALLSSKPISRKEAFRLLQEAKANSENRSAYAKGVIRELDQRLGLSVTGTECVKPLDSAYVQYVYTNAPVRTLTYGITREKDQALNVNNDGVLYGDGSNYLAGFVSRAEGLGPFSFYLNPEYRILPGMDRDPAMRKGYFVLDLGWDLVVGKNSQWWGPGYHGAILLTDNAEPLTLLQLTNPIPQLLPWFFDILGPYRFTFFVTRLEPARTDFPRPYFWGMRFNFKPHDFVELGIARTALLGGTGRPTTARTWINSLTGQGEHEAGESGDQRAGYDVKISLPFQMQPLQVYLEGAGEDGIHLFPSQWAYLYGLYLPRVLSAEGFEFRLEFARTDSGNASRPSIWYTHHLYTAGYTVDGLIMGHHVGTDSRGLFTQIAYRVPDQGTRLSLSFNREFHHYSSPVRERESEVLFQANIRMSDIMDLGVGFGYSSILNVENMPGSILRSMGTTASLTRRF